MSYCCDIAIAIENTDFDKMYAAWIEEYPESYVRELATVQHGHHKEVSIIRWNNFNWYNDEDKDEVEWILSYLEQEKECETLIGGYDYIRIGEEYGDIEAIYLDGEDEDMTMLVYDSIGILRTVEIL